MCDAEYARAGAARSKRLAGPMSCELRAHPRHPCYRTPAMTMGPMTSALQAVITRAAALPAGDAERHVQTCARHLAAACMRRADVREAVDHLAAAVASLQETLHHGARRRAQHDSKAVERLLETFQEELLPELRRQELL
jgi:hypothetical protein